MSARSLEDYASKTCTAQTQLEAMSVAVQKDMNLLLSVIGTQ